ncbi:unnamed protein product [Adineta ricciae]|uniref:Uncharacterized protein n=1 Tax=Adineta ricciae TaxID=249248 RepID=A0A814FIU2_ADIRI|nr:unnamed protein product [Adineta ricciae]
MSVPSKSIDKNKRYAGVKANDYVNKTRTNETSRATARAQGWANLGKINSRRIPPPANVPSLKSETNANTSSFDPTAPTSTSHGWTASGNQTPTNLANSSARPLTPSKQPTQQQLDSIPANASTPPPYSQQPSSSLSSDLDKPRAPATWSTVTSGHNADQPPNLLGLNDFPRLVTQDNKTTKTPSDALTSSTSSTTTQGPSFRPANLASWKEGGGRVQPVSTDSPKDSNDNNNNNNTNLSTLSMQPQILPSNTNSNLLQSQMSNTNNPSYMRTYPTQQQQQQQQMWSYNSGNSYSSYGANQASASVPLHHHHQQQQQQQQQQQRVSSFSNNNSSSQQRLTTATDYKTPTILRNKDIDDLSKITANVTWASASQEVNYEEKIRFSDDEDNDISETANTKSRRFNNNNSQQQSRQTYPQVLQNSNRSPHGNYSQQQSSTHSRLLQDDEHVKQMQDDKNTELISTLTVAKQRRDEQERNLRDTIPQRSTSSTTAQKSFDEQKQVPGYQTRPLLSSTAQENLPPSVAVAQMDSTTSSWAQSSASRPRHDTGDSQTFTMKSWSDQMDSFNYASLHEKSGADGDDHDDTTVGGASGSSVPHKYSRSHSESSSQSQPDNGPSINRSKHFPISNRKTHKSNTISSKTSSNVSHFKSRGNDEMNYVENSEQHMKSNDQWGDWEDSNYSSTSRYQQQQYPNDRRRQTHQQSTDDLSQKSNRYNEQTNDYNRTKQSAKPRSNVPNRPTDLPTTTTTTTTAAKSENKSVSNRAHPAWRALSPTRAPDSNDPTPHEVISHRTESKTTDLIDRRQSAPVERKPRYATTPTTINTSSIPSLMSVRSDVIPTPLSQSNPASSLTSKHYKTSNQSQRQDYNSSSHYSQRNDFYNETNDPAWGNDDDYYDDETGYYDSSIQTHQRHHQSIGYHSHTPHRGYTTLGSYGRYRRSGTLRHQQQYSTYNANNASGTSSSQLNTSTGSKTKKTPPSRTSLSSTNKKTTAESIEPVSLVTESSKSVSDSSVKKPSAWATETQPPPVEEIPIIKLVETPTAIPSILPEKPADSTTTTTTTEPVKTEIERNLAGQSESESTNKKSTAVVSTTQKKPSNKDQQNYQQDQRYQNQQTSRHRTNYSRAMQDYDAMQMTGHNYYGTTRLTARGGRNTHIQDLSTGYYYEHPQQRYNSRYNYSTDPYSQSRSQTRSITKTTKRGGLSSATDRKQTKSKTVSNSNNTSSNLHQQSVSDNELKEGEEWETASESSGIMRSNHQDGSQQPANKSTAADDTSGNRDRTPPKKSFSSQRPLSARHNEGGIHRRTHNFYDRTGKTSRGLLSHRSGRLSANAKQSSPQKADEENLTTKQTGVNRKDQHRHSLDGYDLNNVAGVVKIETLPAGALEEESAAFDDGGEEFCVVMSKRGRKEQKAAQLSKQNAIESLSEQMPKSTSIDNDEQQTNEKSSNDDNQGSSTRTRNGKSLPPRFNSKSATRQQNAKNEHQNNSMYYYDQNYYYYDQSQYYDDNSYYNYGSYNQSHRQTSTRRKQRSQQHQDSNAIDEHSNERKADSTVADKTHSTPSNVMSNIQMWDPHTDSTMSNPSKLIEKPTHDRKFGNEIVPPSSSNDASLPLHQRTASALPAHSPVSKTHETIARTIKPPSTDNKSDRDNKAKSSSYEKNDTIASLGSNQLFEKNTFLDYDDKQSIGTVGDDLNQKINSIKTIWDISDHPRQLEQTINSMVAMKQQQQKENTIQATSSAKADNYVPEPIPTSSANISGSNTNVPSSVKDETHSKNPVPVTSLQSAGSSSTMNQSGAYSSMSGSNKNEQKNICTVKPTQQVPPNIQDQVDVGSYPVFPPPALQPTMSQASLQQHLLPQSQMNPLHQQPSYPFYEGLLPPPQQQPPQQQQPFNRIYSSNTNTTSTDPMTSDFSGIQSSQIYPPQNFPYRNTNLYMQPPPNVPNTNSMYHHTSQGSMSAPPQNNALPPPPPPPMSSYPSPFLVDHGAHMLGQAQPPPPPQGYMNNQMMSGRPQGGPFYRTPPPPPQQIQTPPGGPYGSQDPLAHGGYYTPFFPPPNSNGPPGHPTTHNLYGQNDGFHPPHPPMFNRGGSIDRGDHPLMSQPLSRQTNYPSTSSNQQPPGPPPSLLSQNIKPPLFTNQQQTSSSNQLPFYPPPPNQFNRQGVPISGMNSANNRPQNQQVRSLTTGLSKNLPNNGNDMTNTQPLFSQPQPLFPQRQPLLPPQSNNNRPSYPHHPQYSNYSKPAGPNDDTMKQKHI